MSEHGYLYYRTMTDQLERKFEYQAMYEQEMNVPRWVYLGIAAICVAALATIIIATYI